MTVGRWSAPLWCVLAAGCVTPPQKVAEKDEQPAATAAADAGFSDDEFVPMPTEDEPLETSSPQMVATKTGPSSGDVWRLSTVHSFRQPVSYNAVGFAYKSRTNAQIPPWQSVGTITRPSFGMQLSYRHPLGPQFGVTSSLLYFVNDDIASDGAFDSAAPRSRVSTLTSGTAKALTVDADYAAFGGDSWTVLGRSGLGVFGSSVAVDSLFHDSLADKTYTVASYSSYLYELTLDAGVSFAYQVWKGLLISVDILTFMPLAAVAHGDSGYVDFNAGDFGSADYQLSALRSGVKHRASGLGYAAAWGAGWQF